MFSNQLIENNKIGKKLYGLSIDKIFFNDLDEMKILFTTGKVIRISVTEYDELKLEESFL